MDVNEPTRLHAHAVLDLEMPRAPKTTPVSVRLTEGELAMLVQLARPEDEHTGDVLRRLLHEAHRDQAAASA